MGGALLSETEPGDQRTVPAYVLATEVLKEPAAFADQPQQASPASVVVAVYPEVLAQLCDSPGEKADLDFDRAGVLLMDSALADDGRFLFAIQGFDVSARKRETGSRGPCRTPSPRVKGISFFQSTSISPCFPQTPEPGRPR